MPSVRRILPSWEGATLGIRACGTPEQGPPHHHGQYRPSRPTRAPDRALTMLLLLACTPSPPPPINAIDAPPATPVATAAPPAPVVAAPAAPVAPPAPVTPAPSIFPTPPVPPAALGAVWVDRGVCPGECCTYGTWTATQDVTVVKAPGSAVQVGSIPKDAKVEASTGEVHTTPVPAKVLAARQTAGASVKPGDVIWVLTFTGEGYAKVWENGKIVDDLAIFVGMDECRTHPESDPENCWAVTDRHEFVPDPWWVKVKSATAEGWVDNTHDVLTGFDACG